jgi:hypothetical protein
LHSDDGECDYNDMVVLAVNPEESLGDEAERKMMIEDEWCVEIIIMKSLDYDDNEYDHDVTLKRHRGMREDDEILFIGNIQIKSFYSESSISFILLFLGSYSFL